MQRHVPRVSNPGVVPVDQNLLSFHLRQEWQFRHVPVGIVNNAFQQNLEMSQHSLDAIGVKQIRVVLAREAQSTRFFENVQRQVELRRAAVQHRPPVLQPWQCKGCMGVLSIDNIT
jgi:hypothetical protein